MMRQHDDAMLELTELYALGGLEPHERQMVEQHLAQCAQCRQALAQGRLTAYALAASQSQTPPPALRARVLAIAERPQSSATVRRLVSMPLWKRPVWLATAAAVVVVVFAATWAIQSNLGSRSWAVTCTTSVTKCSAHGRVLAAGPSALRLETHGLQPLPAGKVYQAWYIRRGAPPTPAPTFRPDANGDATVDLPVGANPGLTVAVTVEPEGGSKAPTTKPFLVASIN